MKLHHVVETSSAVGSTRSRLKKYELLAGCLRRADPGEREVVVAYLSGLLPQGKIGLGPAMVHAVKGLPPVDQPALEVLDVHRAFDRIRDARGAGSQAERSQILADLLRAATQYEQSFLRRLAVGELRQGALEGLMVEAVARVTELPVGDIRRSVMVSGDLQRVAAAVLKDGAPALDRFRLQIFQPLLPMLAQPAEDVEDAFRRHERLALETKLDGARIQVHKSGGEVRVFTRRLNDVTLAVPEVVERVAALTADELVLDGEVIALREDGSPLPFQTTMSRFGRKIDVDGMRARVPLSAFFFDALALDGRELLDRPLIERIAAMEDALPADLRVPRLVSSDPAAAQEFLDREIQRGHEGVMAKALDAGYDAGGRGAGWLKIKQVHTLDLVVLACEWGSGRRRGLLSNLHLGAADPERGFVMLGKTFKGLTDETLAWQTKRLLEIETHRDEYTVYVRPELVVEIAFNDVQQSPHYPGGMALRFARVKRYRPDKRPDQADTIDAVRRIFETGRGRD